MKPKLQCLPKLPFDRLDIAGENHDIESYTADEYLQIPLKQRARLIMEDRVTFYIEHQAIETRKALNELRNYVADLVACKALEEE